MYWIIPIIFIIIILISLPIIIKVVEVDEYWDLQDRLLNYRYNPVTEDFE